MTAIIRYKISYTVAGKGPFMLSFALGNDVSLRRVLRLPALLAMGADINLVKGLLSCLGLNRSLPLNCNLRVKVHPRVLLLIITRPLFPQEFPLTWHIQTHYYIIHQLKVFLNKWVHVHLRTIYLLPTISLTILSHGSSHTFHLTLLLLFLSNWPFPTFFRVLYCHTLVIIISQTTFLSMLSLCRQK